jgi:hypothetical protein
MDGNSGIKEESGNDAAIVSDSGNGNSDSGRDSNGGNRGRGRPKRSDERRSESDSNGTANAGTTETINAEIPVLIGQEAEPKKISLNVLTKDDTKKKRTYKKRGSGDSLLTVSTTLSDKQISEIFDWLFKAPRIYGMGSHWELSKSELSDLTQKTKDVLDLFPESIIETYIATGAKWLAPLSLIFTVLTLASARYAQTQMLQKYDSKPTEKINNAEGINRNSKQSETPVSDVGNESSGAGERANSVTDNAVFDSLFGRVE